MSYDSCEMVVKGGHCKRNLLLMGVRSLQERGGRIFLIGDLNYNNMYLSVTSILYIDAFYDAIRDNKISIGAKK